MNSDRFFTHRLFGPGVISAIIVLTLLAYSNTFYSSFHFDDVLIITNNLTIRDLANFPRIIARHRGVSMLTFALNYAVGGLDVFGYHIVNLLIHIVNGVLAYYLLVNTFTLSGAEAAWSKRISAFAALLFVVHPVQTQSVTYIVQRMESLSSLFYLAGLLCFVKGVKAKARFGSVILYAGVAFFYILGFYSKEIAITLPVAVLLYDFIFISEGKAKGVFSRWPLYLTLFVLMLYMAGSAVGLPVSSGKAVPSSAVTSAGPNVQGIGFAEYLLTQMNVVIYYITLLFAPLNQNLEYGFPISNSLFETPYIKDGVVLNIPLPPPALSLAIIAVLCAAAFFLLMPGAKRRFRHSRAVSFFILWFFLILAPTSSFLPIIDVIYEHRLYLPSLGFFAVVAIVADSAASYVFGKKGGPEKAGGVKGRRVWLAVCLAAVFACTAATYARNFVWKDDVTLWGDVARKTPTRARVFNNLAEGYMERGDYRSAVDPLQKAVSIDPKYEEPHYNLGLIYLKAGSLEAALSEFEKTVEIGRYLSGGHFGQSSHLLLSARSYLGNILFVRGEYERAIEEYNEVLKMDPGAVPIRFNLALSYKKTGQYPLAREEFARVLKDNPNDREAAWHLRDLEASGDGPSLR